MIITLHGRGQNPAYRATPYLIPGRIPVALANVGDADLLYPARNQCKKKKVGFFFYYKSDT